MKDWDYYSIIDAKYPCRGDYKRSLIERIENTPMTKAERDEQMGSLSRAVNEWFMEAVKPYNAEVARKTGEFWADARAELGYDKLFTAKGVAALEHAAWEQGHSAGFSDVWCCLCDLVELAQTLHKTTIHPA